MNVKIKKNISVFGLGYVGLSNALMLAKNHNIYGFEIDDEKLLSLKNGISPIKEELIETYLKKYYQKIIFTKISNEIIKKSDIVIIATPTDYDPEKNFFDTKSVEKVIDKTLKINRNLILVIKSTIPIGFTERMSKKYKTDNIIFSPEFLREGNSLYDNLYPSRIIVGNKTKKGEMIAHIFKKSAKKKEIDILLTNPSESEAIKLFANNYLAMRVAFFNELDSFSLKNNLITEEIINGISLDPRIGPGYNNPSFGYGGYCLPKDTKQLLSNYGNIPQNLIQAIVDSNETRKNFLIDEILNTKATTIGIYRLIMKAGSDNFRSSSIIDIIYKLHSNGKKIIIFEPSLKDLKFDKFTICNKFKEFNNAVDLIIANRIDNKLSKYKRKIFTRDIFREN